MLYNCLFNYEISYKTDWLIFVLVRAHITEIDLILAYYDFLNMKNRRRIFYF